MSRSSVAMQGVLGLVGLLGSACTVDHQIDRRVTIDTFVQEPASAVDSLWVVDNSPSMAEEQLRLADAFGQFVAGLEDSNVDFRIGVVTTDMDLDNTERGAMVGDTAFLTAEDDYVTEFRNRVRVGTDGSDKEKGLSAALYALTEPMMSGVNEGFLRADATLAIQFVSDEDDCSDNEALAGEGGDACYERREDLVSVKQFITAFQRFKEPGVRFVASSIVGMDISEGCQNSWPGHRYRTVAEKTGGVIRDICEPDYGMLMGDLGLAVSGIIRVFQLSYAAVEESLEVSVGDTLVPQNTDQGWTYDSEYRSLRFDGEYVPPRGATISVRYEVAGI